MRASGVRGGRLRPSRLRWLTVAATALFVVASVLRFQAPNYVLEPGYSDHLRHEYSSWAFIHIGLRVFDTPLGEWHVHAAHPHELWKSLPAYYPPGIFLVFLPFGLASNLGLIPDARVHMLMVMVLGAGSVVASFLLLRTLQLLYEPALALVVGALCAVLFVTWGLDGFIDPLAAGLAVTGIYWSERSAPGRGLLALCGALSLHFRLWYLWPVALALAVRERHRLRTWQLAAAGVLAASSLLAFVLAVPSVSKLGRTSGAGPNNLALTHGLNGERAVAVVAGIVLLLFVYLFERRLTPVACLALTLALVFGVNQWEAWYPVLLVPIFVVVRNRWSQAAVAIAFLQTVAYLGGFPNLLRTLQLYIQAVR